jgi:hypothetical protein
MNEPAFIEAMQTDLPSLKPTFERRWQLLVAFACYLLLGICPSILCIYFGTRWVGAKLDDYDRFAYLSKSPPAAVFKRVLGIVPPQGVKGIVAAGYAPFNGEGWMRFQADDVNVVLHALKTNPNKPFLGPDEKYNDWEVQPRAEGGEYSRMVGWDGIRHGKNLEYYQFSEKNYSGWGGVVVVDRRRKLFFVAGVIN